MTLLKDCVILVIGAGRIGSDVCLRLANENRVYAVDRYADDSKRKSLEKAGVKALQMDANGSELKEIDIEPDYVFIEIAFKNGAEVDPITAYQTNVFLPIKIMRKFKSASGIIHGSTGNVYGFSRDRMTEKSIPAPVDKYGQSRYVGELMIDYFSRVNDTPAIILRTFYGNNARYGIIRKLAEIIKAGDEIPPEFGREVNWIAHTDLVSQHVNAAAAVAVPPPIVNVTSPEPVAVWELVGMIAAELNVTGVSYAEGELSENWNLSAEAKLQEKVLGLPHISLKTLIREVVQGIND